MINAESVKAKLKNQAIKTGRTMQDELVTYGLERTLYRISISDYAEQFTLKGGILLYALFEGDFTRVTSDIDLLAQSMTNDEQRMYEVFMNVFSIECDDALRFDIESLKVISITEFKEYHGVNVSVFAYLNRTKIAVSIDIGFGDVIFPKRERLKFPTIIGMNEPELYVYSIYSIIAEKFEAIVSLGMANSRYKDFYDIYILATNFELEGEKLKRAIEKTFSHRGTSFDDIVAFTDYFIEDRNNRWRSFINKKKAMIQVELRDIIELLKHMLNPIVAAIEEDSEFNKNWDKNLGLWRVDTMKNKNEKTNAMRILEKNKINYHSHFYYDTDAISGVEVANVLNQNPEQVFKTLVTVGSSKNYYVFLVPVEKSLNLKKAAKAVSEKSIEMIPSKDLLSLTGYIHGGCSPIGMKKQFKTVIDSSAQNFDTIIFSGGKIGYQVELTVDELSKVIRFELNDICD